MNQTTPATSPTTQKRARGTEKDKDILFILFHQIKLPNEKLPSQTCIQNITFLLLFALYPSIFCDFLP